MSIPKLSQLKMHFFHFLLVKTCIVDNCIDTQIKLNLSINSYAESLYREPTDVLKNLHRVDLI